MHSFDFPRQWDERAKDAISSIVDLELDHQNFDEFFDSFLVSHRDNLPFVGDLIIAISLMVNTDFRNKLPNFSEYCDSNPEVWDVLKYGISYAQKVMRENDLDVYENHVSQAAALHKAIAAILVEGFVQLDLPSRITFRNSASEFTLFTNGRDLCVSYNLDGQKDGGAATLTTTFLQAFAQQPQESWVNANSSNYVSERYCAGLEVLHNYKELDTEEITGSLIGFYSMFRSIGSLDIEFLPEVDSPWNFVLASLASQQDWLQMRINPGKGRFLENSSDF